MKFEHILFLAGCYLILRFLFSGDRTKKLFEKENKKTETKEFMTTTDKIVLEIL